MKKRCEIEKVAVVDKSIMLRFKATCTDARYEYECQYLKTIIGYGIRNDRYDTYIEKKSWRVARGRPRDISHLFRG